LFLNGLFRQGGLAGNTPAEAFFVQCDDQTNPPAAIAQGQMLARVGFAPAYPAEFVVVNITRTAESLAVTEQT
jgi:phage tail sheath protein FI